MNVFASRDKSGDAQHHGCAGEDGGPAGDVETYSFDGTGETGTGYAGHGLDVFGGVELGRVEGFDVFEGGVDGLFG